MRQVLLPFAPDAKGQTLYDKMLSGKLLLGPGLEEDETRRPGMCYIPGPCLRHCHVKAPTVSVIGALYGGEAYMQCVQSIWLAKGFGNRVVRRCEGV
jgi:hypothetical protein